MRDHKTVLWGHVESYAAFVRCRYRVARCELVIEWAGSMIRHRQEVAKTATGIEEGFVYGLTRSVSVIVAVSAIVSMNGINSDGFNYPVRHLH